MQSNRPAVVTAGAAFVAGVALWLSRASFDVVGTVDAPQRVAMLPALSELAGLLVLAFLVAAALSSLLHRSVDHGRLQNPAIDVFMPLFALAFLAVPYLPWVPDALPALRLFAGPGRALLWIVVLGHVAWLLLAEIARRFGQPPLRHVGPFAGSLMVFAVSLGVFGWAAAARGAGNPQWPSLIAAGVTAAIVWVAAVGLSGSKAAATFGWASVCLSVPFVLNSHLIPGTFVDLYVRFENLVSGDTSTRLAAGAGLLFDQEFGIAAYAPVYLAAFVGLVAMVQDSSARLPAIILISAALLLALTGSLEPWWNESMMPGQAVVLLLPLLAVPIAWLYKRTSEHPLQRAGMHTLVLVSVAVTLVAVIAVNQVPLPQEGDGSSSLLQWMSPAWDVWNKAPTFVGSTPFAASVRTTVWLTAFTLAALLLSRKIRASAGSAALLSVTAGLLAMIAAASVNAALPLDDESPFSPDDRVLLPMLETFDPVARPIAVRYDPLSVVGPADLPPLFSLAAVPGQRRNRQPVRVVLNARFRLPAGQYQVDIERSGLASSAPEAAIGLQIGRDGRPLETWSLPLAPGGQSRHQFSVPLDAEFVGFRASRQVERTISALRVTALDVVDVKRRLRTPTVRASADFTLARVFFHDAAAHPERDGFWVKGRTTVSVTVLKPLPESSVTLAVHGGARPNVVTFSTRDWSQRIDLVPGVTTKIVLPAKPDERLIALSINTENGFVPAEVDSGSNDDRLLGAWIAFIPDDSAKTSEAP